MPGSPKGCKRVAGGRRPPDPVMNHRTLKECQKEANSHLGSTYYSLHYHVVFSTKERRQIIKPEWRPRLHSYLGGMLRRMDGVAESVGGVDDHVHVLMSLRPVHCLADVMRDLKKDSTNWVKDSF